LDCRIYWTWREVVPVTELRVAETVMVPAANPLATPRLPAALLTSATAALLESQVA
jgi:hypothetical protein